MSNSRLLLADDSVTIQKVVNLTFAEEGYEVFAASDGDSALQKIYEQAPDLILADVNMPGLSGYQLCERVKNSGELSDTPVILLVGSFEPFDEIEARRVGADDVLTKPFHSIRELVSKVNSLLASKQQVGSATSAGASFAPDIVGYRSAEFSGRQVFETDKEIIESSFEEYTESADAPLELFDEEADLTETTSDEKLTRVFDEDETEDILSTGSDSAVTETETDYVPMMESRMELDSEELPSAAELAGEMGYTQTSSEEQTALPETSYGFEFTAGQAEEGFDQESDELLQLPELELEDYSDDELEASRSSGELPLVEEEASQTYHEETRSEEYQTASDLPAAHFSAYAQSDELDDQQISVTSSMNAKTAVADVLAGEYPPEMIDAIAQRVIERMSDQVIREIAWEVVPPLAESAVEKMARKKLEQ